MINLDHSEWDISIIERLLQNEKIKLDEDVLNAVRKNREYLQKKVDQHEGPIYGINTGFGSLCDIKIPKKDIHVLQMNLVRSHACGTGDEVPAEIIGVIQALKIKNLSLACSGIRTKLLNHMVDVYNSGIRAEIFQQGSLGASGDLAPLSHLAITLIGEGNAYINNKKISSLEALKKCGLSPISLAGKEGLALLNGTQFSTAYLGFACHHGHRLIKIANLVTAMSYEAYSCSKDPLDPRIHKIRRQKGQIEVANEIRNHLRDSGHCKNNAEYVQDPYSFRCVPQVHGASLDTLNYCSDILVREINAVTDNPLIFSDTDNVLSGGNFHAQPIALANDFLAIALSELGSISERRIFNLIDGKRNLPSYLIEKQGLNSGYMIAQYTAAAIASENKQLCTPASIDSITSSKGQEDHVSMAANAGRKLYRVVHNLYQILAIELIVASQALDFKGIDNCSTDVLNMYKKLREYVPFIEEDVILGVHLRKVKDNLMSMEINKSKK